MSEQEPRGHQVKVSGQVHQGSITVGDNNTVISSYGEPDVEVKAVADFARAVRQALPSLDLGPEQETVRRLAEQLLEAAEAPQPDHRRLRALGQSLRTILESGIGGALGEALLNGWHP